MFISWPSTARSGEWPAWFSFLFSGCWRALAKGTAAWAGFYCTILLLLLLPLFISFLFLFCLFFVASTPTGTEKRILSGGAGPLVGWLVHIQLTPVHAACWVCRVVCPCLKGTCSPRWEVPKGTVVLRGARHESWVVVSACLRSASSALEVLRPMQGHSAPPVTSTTHQLAAEPRKVRLSFRKRSTGVEKAGHQFWRFATNGDLAHRISRVPTLLLLRLLRSYCAPITGGCRKLGIGPLGSLGTLRAVGLVVVCVVVCMRVQPARDTDTRDYQNCGKNPTQVKRKKVTLRHVSFSPLGASKVRQAMTTQPPPTPVLARPAA